MKRPVRAGLLVLSVLSGVALSVGALATMRLPHGDVADLDVAAQATSASAIYVPAVAHVAGVAGTNWRTDLELRNPYASQAAFTIDMLLRNTDNSSPQSQSFTLEPGNAVRFIDILDTVFHTSGAATLRVTVTNGGIQATARTYNLMLEGNPLGLPAGATFGQRVPAYSEAEALSSTEYARLIMLSQDANFRTNLGYVNTTGTTIKMSITLFTKDSVPLGTLQNTADTTLRPYEYRQIDKIFEKATSGEVSDGYAIVRTLTTGGKFLAYASVNDNRTGDPICVTPAPIQSQAMYIATSAHLPGAAGTNWRTDVEARNPVAQQATFAIDLLKRGVGIDNTSPETATFTLEPGVAMRYDDVVDSVFHFYGAAALRIRPTGGSLLATSRTYNLMVAGNPLNLPAGSTFGQFVPAFGESEAIPSTDAARIIMLTQDASYRTNLGFVNATASQLAMSIDLFRSDFTRLGTLQGTAETTLPPYGYIQIDKVFQRVTTSDVADGYAIVRTTTPGGKFFAFASVIDQRTGDPVYVTPTWPVIAGAAAAPTPNPTSPPAIAPVDEVATQVTRLGRVGTT